MKSEELTPLLFRWAIVAAFSAGLMFLAFPPADCGPLGWVALAMAIAMHLPLRPHGTGAG